MHTVNRLIVVKQFNKTLTLWLGIPILRIIQLEELFRGTIDGASVCPREVVKRALHHNAAAIIFAHNHPSGIAEPSQADRKITEKLQQALELLDIRVLDHFIIGDGQPYSFAEHGLI